MEILQSVDEMQAWSLRQRAAGQRIGLVPTMGCLHNGHISLVHEARKHVDAAVVSIFVNPTQFGPNEDFASYPRNQERDLKLCQEANVALLFMPPVAAMYHDNATVYVDEQSLSKNLCGARRPGHFRGVCSVVAKLFNIVLPHVAVFGQKDYQQAAIIKRMIRDLNFPIELVVAPIVREADGLALSSRNSYLKADERPRAVGLSKALQAAIALHSDGQQHAAVLTECMRKVLSQHDLVIDYAEVVDGTTLEPLDTVATGAVVVVAAWCGTTRLIDNMTL